MDKVYRSILAKVWKHSGIDKGFVWTPRIKNIGGKGQRFVEGAALSSCKIKVPEITSEDDWYWTPAVSLADSRKAGNYPSQRVVWVDCDESYDDTLLTKLMPTYLWETSPGHKQAIWLLKDHLPSSEYHKDGFMGMLTQALGGDKSGVDIGQLLRIPGSVHHKGDPFKGRVIRKGGPVQTSGQLLTRVAKGLGFPPGLASEIGAEDPYGDRSKKLWQFSRTACELGLPEDLTYKLIKACKWNKWRDDPERLKDDIKRAYTSEGNEEHMLKQAAPDETPQEDEVEVTPWRMEVAKDFGAVIRKPLKWIVPGLIPEAGCGLLVASPKVGKTRIAIELALGVATGTKPLGLTVRKPLPVGFFSLEDGKYLFSSRLNESLNCDAGRYHYHWEGHIAQDLVWRAPKPMQLLTNFEQVDLSQGLDKNRLMLTIQEFGLKLIIIDTLSMAIGKSDVSSSTDMYAILKDIKTIAKTTECAVMFIHHTRKRVFDKGESIQEKVLGSTALHAWSDFVISLAPPEEGSDLIRMGVQTKMGMENFRVTQALKIVPKYVEQDEEKEDKK